MRGSRRPRAKRADGSFAASFIHDLGSDGSVPPIVRAVLHLTEGLRLPVVADGIDRADQSWLLAELGADYRQGFHFARALPVELALALIRFGASSALGRHERHETGRQSLQLRSVATSALATG